MVKPNNSAKARSKSWIQSKIGLKYLARVAPKALRRPISRVRSVTETSMMFITPVPPTKSEIPAMALNNRSYKSKKLLYFLEGCSRI